MKIILMGDHYAYCEEVGDGFEIYIVDKASYYTYSWSVKYCPFCGELSPEYKKTCFKCNKSSDSEYEFYNYHYDNKTIVLCGICRKELDVAIETDRKKCIKEFLKCDSE